MNDKLLHLIVGFIITFALTTLFSLWIGLVAAIIIGIAKEVYDYKSYGLFDYKDLIATTLGSAIFGILKLISLC